ncbi:prepilin-type N-terminal cleavage/methylation domain-containing protein [Psychrobacter sp. NG27]|uniref:prepilin-type N-terminal cleavage/methylation domain-containing protein n=1 Tax=Psychrobacter sp. NG27 TaxID=2781966 RepID=UPI0018DF28DC|nr:prepilin-type N-terminal cleavage/methylation domain-containing protein [Psychrobacter sp. NG27]MBI0426013.1 prepilin-type N-terminal cleavage/methylation domain-containing protein [Psychrobacter sp. NG27]
MSASLNNRPLKLHATSSGFTLIELMVTIAVLAIIVSIAAPSISTQLANQRVKSTASVIESALKEAKAESIIKRQNIAVIYNSTSTPRTVTLQNGGSTLITYNINSQNTVAVTTMGASPVNVTTVTFQPNKIIANNDGVIYTICDTNSSNETPRQVSINRIANISTINSGSC